EDQPHLALEGGIPGLLGAAVRPARTRLTSHPVPATRKGGSPARSEPGARPEHIGRHRHPPEIREPDKTAENWHNTISNQPRPPAESSRSVGRCRRAGSCAANAVRDSRVAPEGTAEGREGR